MLDIAYLAGMVLIESVTEVDVFCNPTSVKATPLVYDPKTGGNTPPLNTVYASNYSFVGSQTVEAPYEKIPLFARPLPPKVLPLPPSHANSTGSVGNYPWWRIWFTLDMGHIVNNLLNLTPVVVEVSFEIPQATSKTQPVFEIDASQLLQSAALGSMVTRSSSYAWRAILTVAGLMQNGLFPNPSLALDISCDAYPSESR